MITTETYGCDRHGEDAYQGCAMCDLEALRSRLAEAEALLREWVGCGTEYQNRKYRVMQIDHDTHNATVAHLEGK